MKKSKARRLAARVGIPRTGEKVARAGVRDFAGKKTIAKAWGG